MLGDQHNDPHAKPETSVHKETPVSLDADRPMGMADAVKAVLEGLETDDLLQEDNDKAATAYNIVKTTWRELDAALKKDACIKKLAALIEKRTGCTITSTTLGAYIRRFRLEAARTPSDNKDQNKAAQDAANGSRARTQALSKIPTSADKRAARSAQRVRKPINSEPDSV